MRKEIVIFHATAAKLAVDNAEEKSRLGEHGELNFKVLQGSDASRALIEIYDGPKLWAVVTSECIPAFKRPNWQKAVKVSPDLLNQRWICGALVRGDRLKDEIYTMCIKEGRWRSLISKVERYALDALLEKLNDPIGPTWKGEDL